MIAHELETPIAAVRKLNEKLSVEGEEAVLRAYATAATERELDTLTNLVRYVRAVAALEREGFEIEARPLRLEKLLPFIHWSAWKINSPKLDFRFTEF